MAAATSGMTSKEAIGDGATRSTEPLSGPATTSPTAAPTAASPSPSALAAPVAPGSLTPAGRGELPPPGSGEAADPIIQQVMDAASPADLPASDEALLLREGRTAWLAETGRYTQVRIQAATARRKSGRGAVVRLVWAGADPAGTFLDGRPAAVHFTQNGDGTWTRT
ncbi:hypothetical protein [Streptomyces sp. NPDC091371]|uniref:hypothetical protein n=1 Tax=Streptomyces sp. NPDC091371 TaxID=3155303 RepID=UPI00343F2F01